MAENKDGKKSLSGEILSLLEDQMELASLEWRYERKQSVRRGWAGATAVVLAFVAFVYLQVALVEALGKWGISTGRACLSLAILYALLAVFIFWGFGRRDPRGGEPFQGSREELRRNLKWIHKLFT